MNAKIKSIFEKIGLCVSALGVFIIGVLLGKILPDKRNRVKLDSIGHQQSNAASGDADRIREDAGNSAQRISSIIGRIKDRKSEIKE